MTHLGDIAVPRTLPHGQNGTTLPALLAMQASANGAKVALLHKRLGIWHRWTWQQTDSAARRLAAGLAALGVERGEQVVIAGANRPRLLLAMLASQIHGAVPVLVPQPGGGVALADVLAAHAPRVVFAAGEDEVHAIHAVRANLARQPVVVCDDLRGLRSLWDTWLVDWDAFESGRDAQAAPSAAREADAAVIVYSLGVDGPPQPLTFTHRALAAAAGAVVEDFAIGPADRSVLAVPMGWPTALLLGPVQSLVSGATLAFPESDATALGDLREAGPTFLFGPPLLFRQLRQAAFLRTASARQPWRGMLERALGFDPSQSPGRGLLSRWLLGPLRDRLGLSRLRTAVVTQAALAPQVDACFAALGIAVRPFTDPQAEPPPNSEVLEARLSGSVFIRAACVVDGAALVAPDNDALAAWAQQRGERFRSTEELGALPCVRDLLAREIAAAAPQIGRFLIAHNALSPQAGDMTADGCLRRAEVERLQPIALAELRTGGGIAVTAAESADDQLQDAYAMVWPLQAGLGV